MSARYARAGSVTTSAVGKLAASRSHQQIWNGFHADERSASYPSTDLVRFLARSVELPAKTRVLELGCGAGANLRFLVREGFQVAGIDFSPNALDVARQHLRADPSTAAAATEVDLRLGDFRALPWPDESFDVTVDIEAVYANDATGIADALAEIHRVLRPGGTHFGQMFGVETTGFSAAPGSDPHTIVKPTEGPCAGLGPSHFFDGPELGRLFAEFELSLDWIKRTDRGGAWTVFEWLVTAHKPGGR